MVTFRIGRGERKCRVPTGAYEREANASEQQVRSGEQCLRLTKIPHVPRALQHTVRDHA